MDCCTEAVTLAGMMFGLAYSNNLATHHCIWHIPKNPNMTWLKETCTVNTEMQGLIPVA